MIYTFKTRADVKKPQYLMETQEIIRQIEDW